MKHTLAALALLLVAAGLFAVSAKVVDTEGPATVRLVSGTTAKVAIGKSYTTGDSIRTGKNGVVELSQEGLTIRVGPSKPAAGSCRRVPPLRPPSPRCAKRVT